MAEKIFRLTEESAKTLQNLLADYRAGRLTPTDQPQPRRKNRSVEFYLAKLSEDASPATNNEGTIEPTQAEAAVYKINPYQETPDLTETGLDETVWNIREQYYVAESWVYLYREPVSGKLIIDEPTALMQVELQDHLLEFGSAASAWPIKLNSSTGWDRSTGTIEVYPWAGFTGFRFGTAGDDLNNVGDAVWVIKRGDKWYAIGGGHYFLRGSALENITTGGSGQIGLIHGQGDQGLPGGSDPEDTKTFSISAEAFNEISEDDPVFVMWHGSFLAVRIPEDYSAGCGIQIDENNEISINTAHLIGDGIAVSEGGECQIAVYTPEIVDNCTTIATEDNNIKVDLESIAQAPIVGDNDDCTLTLSLGCGLKEEDGSLAVDPSALGGAGIEGAGCGFDAILGDCLNIDDDNAIAFDTAVAITHAISVVTSITRNGDSLNVNRRELQFKANSCGVIVGFTLGGIEGSSIPLCCGSGSGQPSGGPPSGDPPPSGSGSGGDPPNSGSGGQSGSGGNPNGSGSGGHSGSGGTGDCETIVNTACGNLPTILSVRHRHSSCAYGDFEFLYYDSSDQKWKGTITAYCYDCVTEREMYVEFWCSGFNWQVYSRFTDTNTVSKDWSLVSDPDPDYKEYYHYNDDCSGQALYLEIVNNCGGGSGGGSGA